MILAGTGHRPPKLNNEWDLKGPLSKWLKHEIIKILDKENPEKVISGMALGFDTLLALTALSQGIPLLAVIPCDNQDSRWQDSNRKIYHQILSDPLTESIIVCPGPYQSWKMIKRDHYIVDGCDKILACWNGNEFGGTYQTVSYAKKLEKPLIRINPNDFWTSENES